MIASDPSGSRRSPHARGCTGLDPVVVAVAGPFPACAGMHRFVPPRRGGARAVPRMRGDAPKNPACSRWSSSRSPHARGCTDEAVTRNRVCPPFPACAGMHRDRPGRWPLSRAVPRMRGDAPLDGIAAGAQVNRSPHARGCTDLTVTLSVNFNPFPACAGMHRPRPSWSAATNTVPRMRGDAPSYTGAQAELQTRSPHARGCTAQTLSLDHFSCPFPACAGMHRGRCAACSAPRAVPRMRGDAPPRPHSGPRRKPRSPHARGCTARRRHGRQRHPPFPACAGMHRPRRRCAGLQPPVPRMRGDAPVGLYGTAGSGNRSPHARGCTEST